MLYVNYILKKKNNKPWDWEYGNNSTELEKSYQKSLWEFKTHLPAPLLEIWYYNRRFWISQFTEWEFG